MAYDFHYTPTGTGVISGKEVLEQTEDAINDLGNTAISGVQEALDKAEQALTNSENAVDDAQNALNTANNAEGVAIQAQNDVSNLSGTVTNIGNRVTTAEGNISNLQGRMTTAEGNITNLQGRMTTAETNIGNLQTAVSTAQATANSAQQTATTARQQSYVFRYSSTAVVPNSTIAYSTIDNTDNIKSGDKILDVDGKLFEITAVDTTNQTVTVGSALIDLALDANVVHTSGNETVGGQKIFSNGSTFNSWLYFTNSSVTKGTIPQSSMSPYRIYFGSGVNYDASLFNIDTSVSNTGVQTLTFRSAENVVSGDDARLMLIYDPNRAQPRYLSLKGDIEPNANNTYECGSSTNKLKNLHAYHGYFYGVQKGDEFSTNARTELTLLANRDTLGKSCAYITRFRQNRAQGDMQPLDLHMIGFDVVENEVRTNNVFSIQCTDWLNDVPQRVNIVCRAQSYSYGNSANKALFNDLNPGALSFPDLSSGLDISGYITDLTGASNINKFTPTVNGWISIGLSNADFIELYIPSSLIGGTFTKSTINGYAQAFLPVIANKEVRIALKGSSIGWAKFYPNLGNV